MPRSKKREVAIQAFELYWQEVARVERQIVERGYGIGGQCDLVGPRVNEYIDERLWDACKAIEPLLRKFAKHGVYNVPDYVPHLHPFHASSAHVAYASTLNPPERLYSAVDALRSPELLKMKRMALAELKELKLDRIDCRRVAKTTIDDPDEKLRRDARWKLIAHHMPTPGKFVFEPMGQKDLAKELKRSQPTISRLVKELFPGGWKNDYLKSLRGGNIPKGLRLRYADGTRGVEAIDIDE